ncbi:hypothetical protein [Leucobacter luti]|uniref:Branched-subunit amino acid aminotransferase/4-amino-4-deoxychorismate lyase n=1 Tax=Leucobacter luti TaxID=340320 RepID=A0A4Q7TYN6_9MICO|nr:hypothetical protein [Leucobacter luti]MBL3698114.1 hypothetical protein [Leucobacter luti]RZT64802.1 branched-subunit amino acid aminotransferase/4-amino-4-deoxychorismate lyase [Leucobacter luti]
MPALPDDRELLVADSFRVRVRDGRAEARGLAAHLDRFAATAVAAAQPTDPVDAAATAAGARAFSAAALPRIAAYGAGFPRLELWRTATGEVAYDLALRPLPELGDTIELRSAGSFALAQPRRKGPGISRLADLNRALGAEALLLGPAGHAREGATTSLVFWDPAGAGHVIADRERVASVTELLLGRAAQLTPAAATPAELREQEVWAVNALHGIRPVTRLDGVALRAPDTERLRRLRDALDRCWEPLQ